MQLKPVTFTVHLLTMRGYLMQEELVTALKHLACTEEDCFLHVAETGREPQSLKTGFEVRLRCRRTLQLQEPWVIEGDDHYPDHTTYRAQFEAVESITQIVGAIRRLLDTPLLHIHS
jgi:hypothetical protein